MVVIDGVLALVHMQKCAVYRGSTGSDLGGWEAGIVLGI